MHVGLMRKDLMSWFWTAIGVAVSLPIGEKLMRPTMAPPFQPLVRIHVHEMLLQPHVGCVNNKNLRFVVKNKLQTKA